MVDTLRLFVCTLTALVFVVGVNAADDDVVIADQGVEITRAEFEAAMTTTPDKIRNMAARDTGDRFELINSMLQVRKLAAKADYLNPDELDFWKLHFQVLATKRQFMFDRELNSVQLPDLRALAREYYETKKDKYATKPELRASSHILLASAPGIPRGKVREKAQELLDQLRSGADFATMVATYSDDPGSKSRGGDLDRWISFGDPGITPPYSAALFEIDEIGEYSEITDSQFGIHIIRLDAIQAGGYYSFEEVRNDIVKDIVAEHKALAIKEINSRYSITDDAFIDGEAMEELFAPYK
jgi:parvulin-like peptidyl-prolyl isomerase